MPRLFLLLPLLLLASSAQAQASDSTAIDYLGIEDAGQRAALDYGLRFGRDWLRENKVLDPFGLAIVAPGVPNVIAVDDPSLDSQQTLRVLVEMLRRMSETGLIAEGQPTQPLTAAALVFDILTSVPGRLGKTDALCIVLEAPDVPGARSYILPYVRENGVAAFLEPFLREQPPMLIVR